RMPRAKFYQQEEDRGCIASKKRYFYGLNVHLLVTNLKSTGSSLLVHANTYTDGFPGVSSDRMA
ncbi:MAG TPA: hypothetical protein VHK27_02600, partial [Gammaproteobacteria bacterium]|nr:hypothetical protein [Gammaproteobacteria bacterium]